VPRSLAACQFFCHNAISALANDVTSRARTNVVMTAMVVIAHRHTQHHTAVSAVAFTLLHTMHRTACDHWRVRICWLTLLHMLRTFALRWRRLRVDKKGAKGKAKKRRKLSASSQVRVDCDLLPLLLRGLDDETAAAARPLFTNSHLLLYARCLHVAMCHRLHAVVLFMCAQR
jgi:hypothetical protein